MIDMPRYFATQIINGKLKYKAVVKKYPQFKDGIDEILIERGRTDLIPGYNGN